MAEVVLDSSAILGLLWSEQGSGIVSAVIDRALVCVVNEAEVVSALVRRGEAPKRAAQIVEKLPYKAVDLDRRLALQAGALWREFKPRGLSLGDRCCLALAEREGLPVLTSDKRWADLSIGVEVRLFK
jgi:PIN domain nuclease of toxin-antitoxin system